MKKFNPLIEAEDDSLRIPNVQSWSIDKWRLLGAYCDIFTRSMRNKWDQLVYIDLFSGAGFANIKKSRQVYFSSPLIALSTPVTFDKYIFCEKDPELIDSLQKRVDRIFPDADVDFIEGDANDVANQIKASMPPYSKENTRLAFCFVDPFSLNLHFSTIQCLGSNLMDFLILMALHMDGNRNFRLYLDDHNKRIADYIADPYWRDEFSGTDKNGKDFIKYLAQKYDQNMISLGYKKPDQKLQIRSSNKNLPLYYLAFYSKHDLGNDFYKKIKNSATGQTEMEL